MAPLKEYCNEILAPIVLSKFKHILATPRKHQVYAQSQLAHAGPVDVTSPVIHHALRWPIFKRSLESAIWNEKCSHPFKIQVCDCH